jgi:hypothetical protein
MAPKTKQHAGPPITLGNTPVSCRRSNNGNFITVADDLEALVARQPGLTEAEIAKTLFANEGDSQRVSLMCRRLIAEGRLRRSGTGTTADPFTYLPKGGSPRPRVSAQGKCRPGGRHRLWDRYDRLNEGSNWTA